jgi:hypothetical protein
MRTGMLSMSAPEGQTLVAWKKDEQLGWQLYGSDGRPSGKPGFAKSPEAASRRDPHHEGRRGLRFAIRPRGTSMIAGPACARPLIVVRSVLNVHPLGPHTSIRSQSPILADWPCLKTASVSFGHARNQPRKR